MNFGLEDRIVKKIEEVFEANPKVDKALIFGSRAKGNYRPDSDVDIAIKGRNLDFDDVLSLGVKLEELNLPYKIDLLDYHKISEPALTEHIDRVGIEFYSMWNLYKFSDFAQINPTVSLKGNEIYSFVEMRDLEDGRKFCSPSTNRINSSGARFKDKDTLFARITPCLENGKICQVRGLQNGIGFGSTEFLVFRGRENVSDNDFVFYLSRWNEVRDFAENNFEGTSGRQRVPKNCFENLNLYLPPLIEQVAIANILNSLDDKIDLLQRQNKTLEQLAETLFRQWFIEEAEEISEKQIRLGDLIDTVSKTHKFTKNEVIFLNTSDIYLGEVLTSEMSLVKSLPGQAKKTIAKDDILFSEIRPANGRWAYIDFDAEDYVVSTKLMVLRSKNLSNQEFVYFYLTNPKTVEWLQVLAESRSGTFPQITFDQLVDLKINIPSEQIFKETGEWCKIILYKIKKNNKQIQTLTKTRDNLLPKLMSGEIRVNLN